jgi:co-chaperonin GroES (HSP10)
MATDKVYPPARPDSGPSSGRGRERTRRHHHSGYSAKEKPQQGEVIAVGKGKSNDEGKVFPLDVKAGDTILFGKYSGTEIKLDGDEFLIMREEEVLGIVKK